MWLISKRNPLIIYGVQKWSMCVCVWLCAAPETRLIFADLRDATPVVLHTRSEWVYKAA